MARPVTQRQVKDYLAGKLAPGQMTSDESPIMMFTKPEGEDHVTPLSSMGTDKSPFVENLYINLGGRYQCRWGTYAIGGGAHTAVCGACVFVANSYLNYVIRVTTVGVEIFTGTGWVALAGPTLSIDPSTSVEFSVWDQDLMFTDATSGLYTIDFQAGTYTLIAEAPVGLHLTTFDGRAIISNLSPTGLPSRIQWSVKDDNTDWTGLGSGYEDLLSSPGGVVDTQHAIVPVSDSEAFIVRQNSLWLLNTTGVFDTPFAFTEHFDQGSQSPDTCVRIPGEKISQQTLRTLFAQMVCLGTDDVVMMKLEGVFPLGFPIRDQILNNTLNANNAVADFEPRMREYRIFIPNWTQPQTESVVWRYNIDTHLWTHDTYPFGIKRLNCKDIIAATLSISALTGIFAALTGIIATLGQTVSSPSAGALFTVSDTNDTMKEDISTLTDSIGNPLTDEAGDDFTDEDGNDIWIEDLQTTGIPIELRTGLLALPNPLNRSLIQKVQLEYEAVEQVSVNFDYSVDGGNSWINYGSLVLAVTTTPTIVAYRYPREALQLMLRVTSTAAGGLKLHSLTPSLIQGSAIVS